MDEFEFITRATHDPELAPFLQAVADEVRPDLTLQQPQHYSIGGADIVVFFAASALYRWASAVIEARRQQIQAQALEQQAAVIESLVQAGMTPKDARLLVAALVKHNAQPPAEDSVVNKVLKLLP